MTTLTAHQRLAFRGAVHGFAMACLVADRPGMQPIAPGEMAR
jgi:hypothetical protein